MRKPNDRLPRCLQRPSPQYLEVLAALRRGEEPTPQQIVALKNDDVVRLAINQTVTACLEEMLRLLTIRKAHRHEPQ
jgi:hypothetical protein